MPTAVLLEIDRLDDDLAARAPAPGLLPLAGRPLVGYATKALQACGDIDKIVLAGPTVYEDHQAALVGIDETLLSDEPLGHRIGSVLDRYGQDDELLFWAANAPLLRPAMVEQFLGHAPLDCGLCWSVVRDSRVKEFYGGKLDPPKQTLAGEGYHFTPLGLVQPGAHLPRRDLLARLLGGELNAGEMVKLVGIGFAIKYRSGRATLDELAARVGEALGCATMIQVAGSPELVLRVTDRHEHHLARELVEAT